jgi:hypothetical protein
MSNTIGPLGFLLPSNFRYLTGSLESAPFTQEKGIPRTLLVHVKGGYIRRRFRQERHVCSK